MLTANDRLIRLCIELLRNNPKSLIRNSSIANSSSFSIFDLSEILMRSMRQFLTVLLLFILFFSHLTGQTLPDFGSVDVKELSDTQLQSLLRRSKSLGLETDDLIEMAQLQGLSLDDAAILRERLTGLTSQRIAKGSENRVTSTERSLTSPPDFLIEALITDSLSRRSQIFGSSFFGSNALLSFEPNLNTQAPANYKLSSGDEIYIDIYGASEQYFEATIDQAGRIILSNVGPIPVNGLTIDEAAQRIKNRFASFYDGLNASPPTTFLKVSLGNIKTIRVDIVGEVFAPGSYKVSGFNTAFNALYLAGGITDNGTYRSINHFRNNQLLQTIDLYDFLIKGVSDANRTLQNGDVIMVGTYTNRVEVKGALKRPGIFEVKEGESIADLIAYAGGFNENAKTDRISLQRNSNDQKSLIDVFEGQYESIFLKSGDVISVDGLINRFENRILIEGAVFRPGAYSLEQATTLKELIDRADGLKGDAYPNRAYLIRTYEDFNTQNISFSPQDLLSGKAADIALQREDKVVVFSKFDLQEEAIIEIGGEVNQPAIVPFREEMTIEDAILAAGGLKLTAELSNIEVTRLKLGNEDEVSEILNVSVNELLESESDFQVQPFDKITVRRKLNFEPRISVMVEGEVAYPGEYDLTTRTERVSDIIKRAGGLKELSYVKGATLIRRTENFQTQSENQARIQKLKSIKQKLDSSATLLTENELMMKDRLSLEIKNLQENDKTRTDQFTNLIKNERLQNIRERNGLESNVQVGQYETVAIQLEDILDQPGGPEDLLLEDGDVLVIPKNSETIRIRGSIVFPTTLKADKSRSAKHYVNQAGGFAARAKRNKTYVIYPNGEVARTKHFLFFKNYPSVQPGSDIIVPTKGPKNPLGVQQALAITSGLATIALLISQINF